MNVIAIVIPLQYLNRRAAFAVYFRAFLEEVKRSLVEYPATVFGRHDYVIATEIDEVAPMVIFHKSIIAKKIWEVYIPGLTPGGLRWIAKH